MISNMQTRVLMFSMETIELEERRRNDTKRIIFMKRDH